MRAASPLVPVSADTPFRPVGAVLLLPCFCLVLSVRLASEQCLLIVVGAFCCRRWRLWRVHRLMRLFLPRFALAFFRFCSFSGFLLGCPFTQLHCPCVHMVPQRVRRRGDSGMTKEAREAADRAAAEEIMNRDFGLLMKVTVAGVCALLLSC